MMNHPFIARIRAERQILKVINEHDDLGRAPLSGLAPEAIRRWASESLTLWPQDLRNALVTHLLLISERLRLGSSASHRGALPYAPPDEHDISAETHEIRNLLARVQRCLLAVKCGAWLEY